MMTWLQRYRIRLYIRNSLWVLPALSIVVALIFEVVLHQVEHALNLRLDFSPETARTFMSTVAASTLTLLVIIGSAVLVAVQLASAQLTPRIITLVYRNLGRKVVLALFVFTFTFSVAVMIRIEHSVPLLSGYIAAAGFLLSLALFMYFIDSMGKSLRPSSAVRVVGLVARDVIRDIYPSPLKPDTGIPQTLQGLSQHKPRVVVSRAYGAVLAFDLKGLVTLASRSNCLIEMIPQVGDFIPAGTPLFRVYPAGSELSDRELRQCVALGQERTLEQDPLFAFRIIVDIANKGLSPAINDPTTAVLAIDHIHHLLRDIGQRYLAEGLERDAAGELRLIYRTPDWEDFVLLGTTEIRQYGQQSIQVQRRLRAMLEDLIDILPPERHAVLRRELALLDTSLKRTFPDIDDQALAEEGDLQGLGGDDELYQETATAVAQSTS